MDLKVESIFKDVKEIYPSILKHQVPLSIFNNIKQCIKRTDEIRKHELHSLLEHHNVANNSYQVSVPFDFIEGSFFHAYIIYLGEWYRCTYEKISLKETRRTVRLRKSDNHFDSYDCWVNYIEKGDINKMHDHAGNLSGVIYYTDCEDSPIYFENGFSYKAKERDVVIFPSNLLHAVDKHENEKSRITLAFNLYYNMIKTNVIL